MSLGCECEFEAEPGETYWMIPQAYSFLETKRGRRCVSCGTIIKPGQTCLIFHRFKIPESDVEITIYGEDGEIPRAPHHHCEACGDQFFNLTELGFCFPITDEMSELVKEYAEMAKAERERLAAERKAVNEGSK